MATTMVLDQFYFNYFTMCAYVYYILFFFRYVDKLNFIIKPFIYEKGFIKHRGLSKKTDNFCLLFHLFSPYQNKLLKYRTYLLKQC